MMITLHLNPCPLESKPGSGGSQVSVPGRANNRWHLAYTGEPFPLCSLGAREQKLRTITANTSLMPPPFIIARPSKKRTKLWTTKLAQLNGQSPQCSGSGHGLWELA